MTKGIASSFQTLFDRLLSHSNFGEEPLPVLLKQVRGMSERLQRSLGRHGLLPADSVCGLFKLGDFCDSFLVHKETSVCVKSVTLYRYDLLRLCEHFGDEFLVSALTRDGVECFASHLLTSKRLSPITVNRSFVLYRSLYSWGVRCRGLRSNPFEGVRVPAKSNPKRRRYVSCEDIEKSIAATDNLEVRFCLAMGRYAGLRPCEIRLLRLSDFSEDRFRVDWKGKTGQRFVPYFEALRPHVDVFRGIRKEDDPIIKFPTHCTAYTVGKVLAAAGVVLWPKFFINLRASCISDWDGKLSEFQMDSIFGNSQAVRSSHYLQIRDLEMSHVLSLEKKGG